MPRRAQIVALPSVASPAGISYLLPGGELTEIEALCFTLVTSNQAGVRQVLARLQDATGADTWVSPAAGTQNPSLTVVYSFAPLVPAFGSSALGFQGGPFARARSGDPLRLVVTVVNTQAGDVIQNGRLTVLQEPIEPDA